MHISHTFCHKHPSSNYETSRQKQVKNIWSSDSDEYWGFREMEAENKEGGGETQWGVCEVIGFRYKGSRESLEEWYPHIANARNVYDGI